TGTAPFIYRINGETAITTSNNPYTYQVSPAATTTYEVTSLSDTNCSAIANGLTGTATVTVNEVDGGEIAENQHICFGEQPATISSTIDGNGEGTITYRWERASEPFTAWSVIPAAINATYTPPANQYYTYKYRRITTSTLASGKACEAFSNEIIITVQELVTPGGITGEQTICSGDIPGQVTSIEPGTSGAATIEYEWQQSTDDGNSWQPLTGSSENYTFTDAVNTTTLIRRRTVATVSGNPSCYSEYTTPVTITVIVPPTPGLIGGTQTICYNSIPAILTSIQNGTSPGSQITYKWEYSINSGGTWNAISGAQSSSYTPAIPLTETTWFHRITIATKDGKTCPSNPTGPAIVTVQQQVNPGVIGTNQTICYNDTPAPITSTQPGSGSATPAYSWEFSTDGGTTWFTISGATNADYSPGKLIQNTRYRRIATITLNGKACAAVSEPVIIEVLPEIIPPVLPVSQNQEISYYTQPSGLSFTSTGSFNYQWQSITDNVNFTDISNQTGTAYQPGNLTDTTYYRVKTTLGSCEPEYSNTVQIIVWPQVFTPVICCDVFRCIFNEAPPLFIENPANGFGPNVIYQWQRRARILWWWENWENISGATSPTYIPTEILTRYQYRLHITDNCTGNTFTSNTVEVTPALSLSGNLNQSITPNKDFCPEEPFTYHIESGSIGGLFGRTIRYEWEADPKFITPASGGPQYSQCGTFGFYTDINFTTHNETDQAVTTTIYIYPKVYNSNGTVACELDAETFEITIDAFKMYCPKNITESTNEGECFATLTPSEPTFDCDDPNKDLIWVTEGATELSGNGFVGTKDFNKGLTTVTYTAINSAGTETTCFFTVTVTDNEDPTITCPDEIITENDLDLCTAYIEYDLPVVTDNCGSYTIEQTEGLPSGSYFDVGTTTNTFVATDASGNTSTCSFAVTVNDEQRPAFTYCPTNITSANGIDSCSKSFTPPHPDFFDNCIDWFELTWEMTYEGTTTSGDDLLPKTEFEIGTTAITYTLADSEGTSDECTFTVTINDTNQPELVCLAPDPERNTDDGFCTYTTQGTEFDPTATVLCKGFNLTNNLNESSTLAGYVFPIGTTLVQWTMIDDNNQAKVCSFNVIVTDNQAPEITYCPITRDIEGCSTADITGPVFSATEAASSYVEFSNATNQGEASDNCGNIASVTYQDVSNGETCPEMITRTWIVTDDNDNLATCQQTIKIDDTTDPEITCAVTTPQEVVVNSGNTYVHDNSVEDWDATATDNCGPANLSFSFSGDTPTPSPVPDPASLNGVTFNQGTTTVTWTATDDCGNSDVCSFVVEVLGQADLEIEKILTSDLVEDSISAGSQVEYQITVTNNGPAASGKIVLTDNIPTEISDAEYSTDETNWQDWNGTLNIANLDNGASINIFLRGTAGCPVDKKITNTAYVELAHGNPISDPDQSNNTSTVETGHRDNTPPTFSGTLPDFEECVDMLYQATYYTSDGLKRYLDHNNVDPHPYPIDNPDVDFFLLRHGDTSLDLDLNALNYSDNCCEITDDYEINWEIDFDGTEPSVSGIGQPSAYTVSGNPADIKLWGDGFNFQEKTHTITYWITDCHGNESEPIVRDIIITPRPQIIKVTGP
ncbi:MAG: HYR domain-containing protein, partial [Lentisphaerae bacterium]|nr:HYR domain-containing protein [Lentisphaerota bacterium]